MKLPDLHRLRLTFSSNLIMSRIIRSVEKCDIMVEDDKIREAIINPKK